MTSGIASDKYMKQLSIMCLDGCVRLYNMKNTMNYSSLSINVLPSNDSYWPNKNSLNSMIKLQNDQTRKYKLIGLYEFNDPENITLTNFKGRSLSKNDFDYILFYNLNDSTLNSSTLNHPLISIIPTHNLINMDNYRTLIPTLDGRTRYVCKYYPTWYSAPLVNTINLLTMENIRVDTKYENYVSNNIDYLPLNYFIQTFANFDDNQNSRV